MSNVMKHKKFGFRLAVSAISSLAISHANWVDDDLRAQVELFRAGSKAMKDGNYQVAEQKGRELVAREEARGGRRSVLGPALHGEALYALGRFAEAKTVFRKCFWINPTGELSGPRTNLVAVKYGTLLARAGEWSAAKALYYSRLSLSSQGPLLELPHLIVFEPVTGFTTWEATADNYEIAYEMLVTGNLRLSAARMEELVAAKGETWPLIMMRARGQADPAEKPALLERALAACSSAQEREWVQLASTKTFNDRPRIVQTLIEQSGLKGLAKHYLTQSGTGWLNTPE